MLNVGYKCIWRWELWNWRTYIEKGVVKCEKMKKYCIFIKCILLSDWPWRRGRKCCICRKDMEIFTQHLHISSPGLNHDYGKIIIVVRTIEASLQNKKTFEFLVLDYHKWRCASHQPPNTNNYQMRQIKMFYHNSRF